jgi:hypothetical protein
VIDAIVVVLLIVEIVIVIVLVLAISVGVSYFCNSFSSMILLPLAHVIMTRMITNNVFIIIMTITIDIKIYNDNGTMDLLLQKKSKYNF